MNPVTWQATQVSQHTVSCCDFFLTYVGLVYQISLAATFLWGVALEGCRLAGQFC